MQLRPTTTHSHRWLTLLLSAGSLGVSASSVAQHVGASSDAPFISAQRVATAQESESPLNLTPPEVLKAPREGSRRRHLLIAGGVALGVSSLLSTLYALTPRNSGCQGLQCQNWLTVIPVAGPLVYGASYFAGSPTEACNGFCGLAYAVNVVIGLVFVVDAAVQVLGAVLLTVGAIPRVQEPVTPRPAFRISIVPARVGSGNGVALAARF